MSASCHAKALLRAVRNSNTELSHVDLQEIAAEPWFIPDTTTLWDQLQAFRKRREHFALVVDEYGALMGIVTLEDILEEIVGDITDETDISVPWRCAYSQMARSRQPAASTIRDPQSAIRLEPTRRQGDNHCRAHSL